MLLFGCNIEVSVSDAPQIPTSSKLEQAGISTTELDLQEHERVSQCRPRVIHFLVSTHEFFNFCLLFGTSQSTVTPMTPPPISPIRLIHAIESNQ